MSQQDPNAGSRTTLTVVGAVVTLVALVLAIWGFVGFASGVFGDPESTPMGRYFGMFAGGSFLLVIGFGVLGVGTWRARSRFFARDSADAIRTTVAAVRDGLDGSTGAGVHCTSCGAAVPAGARFCPSCAAPQA
ncbi:MAG TPA: zinc ribbon domain-containing protein [Marmoricola sp.]|jgi:uncharacterized membrane protein|nr:zinc ribbon domain-containing protein [Marmoricola sp.]